MKAPLFDRADLIEGFRWPLLKEFATAANLCRFERGDAKFRAWLEAASGNVAGVGSE